MGACVFETACKKITRLWMKQASHLGLFYAFLNYLLPAYLFRVSCVWMAILMMSSVSLHVPSDVWQHYDQLLRGAITKRPSAATRTGKLGGVRPPHKRFALLGGIWSEKHLIVLSVGAPPIDLTLIVLGHSDGCTTGLDTSEHSWTAQGQKMMPFLLGLVHKAC